MSYGGGYGSRHGGSNGYSNGYDGRNDGYGAYNYGYDYTQYPAYSGYDTISPRNRHQSWFLATPSILQSLSHQILRAERVRPLSETIQVNWAAACSLQQRRIPLSVPFDPATHMLISFTDTAVATQTDMEVADTPTDTMVTRGAAMVAEATECRILAKA